MQIDNEFKQLIPPLLNAEREQLEKNLLEHGCIDKLKLWGNILIDGHNRYEICTKHNIEFKTEKLNFDNRNEVLSWIVENQAGRRNISIFQRIVLQLKLKDTIAKLALENKIKAGKMYGEKHSKEVLPNLAKPLEAINTREIIAKKAKVSGGTVGKVEKILKKADSKTINQLWKQTISIDQAHKNVEKQEKRDEYKKLNLELIEKVKRVEKEKRYKLYRANFMDVDIEPESIDLILTDPPYDAKGLPVWEPLAELAKRVLKPHKFLIAYSGQFHLLKTMSSLATHLDYYWTFSLLHSGNNQLIGPRNVLCGWKPLLIFQKGTKCFDGQINDVVKGSGMEKKLHPWQQAEQEIEPLIEHFTMPGDTVLDPFMGSGTIPVKALKMNRYAIGIEKTNEWFNTSVERINKLKVEGQNENLSKVG